MLFNVSQLMREPLGARRQYAIDEEWSPDDSTTLRLFGPVSLLRTDRGVLATAVLASEAAGECDRCLCSLRYPVQMEFSEEYLPEIDPFSGARLPEPEEATPYRINSHHLLDLDEAVRQAWLLAQPMQKLCRGDCRGLCPECGGNLNLQGCRCASGPVDPRWAALAALRGADDMPKG